MGYFVRRQVDALAVGLEGGVTEYHDKATRRILFAGDGGFGVTMAIFGKVLQYFSVNGGV
jgi:hypothetical protein